MRRIHHDVTSLRDILKVAIRDVEFLRTKHKTIDNPDLRASVIRLCGCLEVVFGATEGILMKVELVQKLFDEGMEHIENSRLEETSNEKRLELIKRGVYLLSDFRRKAADLETEVLGDVEEA